VSCNNRHADPGDRAAKGELLKATVSVFKFRFGHRSAFVVDAIMMV